MPVTVWAWGCAQNPTTSAQKVSKVGAVKQDRKLVSSSAIERGRLRVGIGGDLWFGDRVREPPMLARVRPRKQLSRSRRRYQPKTAKLQMDITSSFLEPQPSLRTAVVPALDLRPAPRRRPRPRATVLTRRLRPHPTAFLGQTHTCSSGGPSPPMTACWRSSPASMYRLVKMSVNPAGRFGASETEPGLPGGPGGGG